MHIPTYYVNLENKVELNRSDLVLHQLHKSVLNREAKNANYDAR